MKLHLHSTATARTSTVQTIFVLRHVQASNMAPLYDISKTFLTISCQCCPTWHLQFLSTGIPVLTRALTNMKSFLKKGEDWAKENNVPVQKLLDGKLAEDMKVGPILEH